MNNVFIRWLGLYGKGSSLFESLRYELCKCRREVACAGYQEMKWASPPKDHARIGLRLKPGAVRIEYSGDVWSVTGTDGRLHPTQRPSDYCTYTEAFARPVYDAIVIYGYVSPEAYNTVSYWARNKGLKLIWIESLGAKPRRLL